MRVLVGHSYSCPELQQNRPLPGREGSSDEIVSFGPAYPQFPYQAGMTFDEILARCPQGWEPDVYIHWSPEYNPLPPGMEKSDCFKVGVFGDWFLGGQVAQQVAGAFDLVVSDANGADRLRGLGHQNVISAALYYHDPDVHRFLPHIDRDLDIVFIGNFNHEIQHERARWLARVARLSSRYKVCLTTGLYGEAYTQLMNRAKIVFNRSIGGTINMRAYEAPACGALLFYERENREIRSLFTDRRECVLYGDDDLETLLDFYLTHDQERQAIAEAGHRRLKNETPSQHMRDLLTAIECGMEGRSRSCVMPTATAPEWDRDLRYVRQWLLSVDKNCLGAAEETLRKAEQHGADPSVVAGLRGYLLAQVGQSLTGVDRNSAWAEAQRQWRTAIDMRPTSVAARLNLASMLIETGGAAEAEQNLHAAHDVLSQPQAGILTSGELFWPCRFTSFGVECDRIEIELQHGSQAWHAAMHALLTWRTCEILSDLAFANERYVEAEQLAGEARGLLPAMAATHFRHGRALNALGHVEAAIGAYRAALDINPFLAEARTALAQLLIYIERPSDAITLLEDWAAIIAGCSLYRPHLRQCDQLLYLARQARESVGRSENGLHRLLAFPDWTSPGDWQNVVRAFAERSDPEPALLMLWADPRTGAEPRTLLSEIADYLRTQLRLPTLDFPNITIVAQILEPRDRWKLFHIAHAVLDAGAVPIEFRDVFEASCLPILPLTGRECPAVS